MFSKGQLRGVEQSEPVKVAEQGCWVLGLGTQMPLPLQLESVEQERV